MLPRIGASQWTDLSPPAPCGRAGGWHVQTASIPDLRLPPTAETAGRATQPMHPVVAQPGYRGLPVPQRDHLATPPSPASAQDLRAEVQEALRYASTIGPVHTGRGHLPEHTPEHGRTLLSPSRRRGERCNTQSQGRARLSETENQVPRLAPITGWHLRGASCRRTDSPNNTELAHHPDSDSSRLREEEFLRVGWETRRADQLRRPTDMSPSFLFRIRARHTHALARTAAWGTSRPSSPPGRTTGRPEHRPRDWLAADRAPGPTAAGRPSAPSGPPDIGSRGRADRARVSRRCTSLPPLFAPVVAAPLL